MCSLLNIMSSLLFLLFFLAICLSITLADIDNAGYIPVGPTNIDCFRCRSYNYSDKNCHDPFTGTNVALVEKCQVPMTNLKVKVPGNTCIKIVGTSEITKAQYVLRDCVLDAEEGCDRLTLDKDIVKRCIWLCQNGSGCNGAASYRGHTGLIIGITCLLFSIKIL